MKGLVQLRNRAHPSWQQVPLVHADAAEPPASFEDPPSYGLARDIASGEGGWAPGYESEHKVRVHGVAM